VNAPRRLSLFWQIFLGTAAVLVVVFSVLAFTPVSIRSPLALWEGLVSLAGLIAVLVLLFVLMRRAFTPLSQLAEFMRRADPLRPGPRVPEYGRAAEVVRLTHAFNEMLERLERERRESAGRALEAQESERLRLARELHDEIGQSLTALVLELEHASRVAPPELATRLFQAREDARGSLEEVRRIARRLRPEALDDLGLTSALRNLADRIASQARVQVTRHLSADLPPLSDDTELVVYRVAQEALTNVVRHSGASRAVLRLEPSGRGVLLTVSDDGRGMNGSLEGGGITGIRERALLVDGALAVTEGALGGVEITLDVAAEQGARASASG
jgi:two-component system sensor histidine kinase UhpB